MLYVRVTQWGKTGAALLFLSGVVGEGLAGKVTFEQGLRNCVAVQGRMFQAREDHVQGPCGGEPGPYALVLGIQFCGTYEQHYSEHILVL